MEPTRVFDFIDYQLANYPQQKCVGEIVQGNAHYLTIEELRDRSNQIANGLLSLGFEKGDKIATVMYRNRPEFILLDAGIQKAGLVSVPMYPTISAKDYTYILNDSGAKVAFFGSGDLADKLEEARKSAPGLQRMFSLDGHADHPHWNTMWETQSTTAPEDTAQATDLMTIIYTSGTTGDPKGVMLSHRNIAENVKEVHKLTPIDPGQRVLSFLPLCHIFERSASWSYIYGGHEMTFAAVDNLGGEEGDLRRIKPHFMTCVPRLLEKIYEKIYAKGSDLTGAKKKLFFWALALTEDYEFDKEYSGLAKIKRNIADKLIFSKWREALGGEMRGILSGSAPLSRRIAQVFSAAGIPIREGYGLTESSPGITIDRYVKNESMLGTVGPVIGCVEVRIDTSDGDYQPGEGEILACGPNIMMGYYNKPEETAKTLVEMDGKTWLRTGDIGKFLDGPSGLKYLKITDRKKELLKTSAGKYIPPAPIEIRLKEDILVENAMVVGDKRKFASALILASPDAVEKLCKDENIPWTDLSSAVTHEKVLREYQAIVDKVNADLARHEQVKKFKLLTDVWEPVKTDGSIGELTPTLKLKRRVILAKYEKEIERLYSDL